MGLFQSKNTSTSTVQTSTQGADLHAQGAIAQSQFGPAGAYTAPVSIQLGDAAVAGFNQTEQLKNTSINSSGITGNTVAGALGLNASTIGLAVAGAVAFYLFVRKH